VTMIALHVVAKLDGRVVLESARTPVR